MKKIFSLLLILLLIGCSSAKYETIDSNYAMKLINEGAYIIDVRTEDEYKERAHPHRTGAVRTTGRSRGG